jgi:hypothetical protein
VRGGGIFIVETVVETVEKTSDPKFFTIFTVALGCWLMFAETYNKKANCLTFRKVKINELQGGYLAPE